MLVPTSHNQLEMGGPLSDPEGLFSITVTKATSYFGIGSPNQHAFTSLRSCFPIRR